MGMMMYYKRLIHKTGFDSESGIQYENLTTQERCHKRSVFELVDIFSTYWEKQ